MLTYVDDSIQITRNKGKSAKYLMKLELYRKLVPNNPNCCDNYIIIRYLINKYEVLIKKDFDSLTAEMFDVLSFELLLNEMVIHEEIPI